MYRIKLSATSALVSLWAGEQVYQSSLAKKYLSHLDLSAGKGLYNYINEIYPAYEEVIFNRKWAIKKFIDKYIQKYGGDIQIIIAAAGLDPLGIELLEKYGEQAIHIFEIDREQMDMKKSLFTKISHKNNIKFISADLLDIDTIKSQLMKNSWQENLPSLLIFEGISYYLPRQTLSKIIEPLAIDQFIVDYLKPTDLLNEFARTISMKTFSFLEESCHLPKSTVYTTSILADLLPSYKLSQKISMPKIELGRLGENKHFITDESSWIELAEFSKIK